MVFQKRSMTLIAPFFVSFCADRSPGELKVTLYTF
jgi:hypothetical protein